MPLQKCQSGSKPGIRWGQQGKCYTYTPGDKESLKNARKQAIKQGYAEDPKKFKEEMASAQTDPVTSEEFTLLVLEDLFSKSDNTEDPSSEELMVCDKCGNEMTYDDAKEKYACAKCGNTKDKEKASA